MIIDDEYIVSKYIDSIGRIITHKLKTIEYEELKYLQNRFNDSDSINETIHRIYNKIEEKPKCKYCCNYCKPKNSKFTKFYDTCSNKECAHKSAVEKRKNTFIQNHNGLTNVFQLPDVIKKIQTKKKGTYDKIVSKIKQTKLEKYGDENYNNQAKSKQTCLEKYGVEFSFQSENNKKKSKQTKLEKYGDENYNNHEKSKQTCLEKYGVEHVASLNTVREKMKKSRIENNGKYISDEMLLKSRHTCLERYGNETYNNREQAKSTTLERYGCENVVQNAEIKEKMKKTRIENNGKYISDEMLLKSRHTCLERYGNETYNNREKSKQTCLELYNVSYFSQTQQFKDKLSYLFSNGIIQEKTRKTFLDKYGVEWITQLDSCKQKSIETKRRNNSFNKSQPEEDCYELLKSVYDDVMRQYRDERYPFNCDFYIPSLDLFIEFNGSQYHHRRPYLGTEEDIKEANELLEKDKKLCEERGCDHTQYKNIWHCWTIRDPKKRQIAKENKLNFIEFWNLKEVEYWLNHNN